MFRWSWLKELARRSREVFDRRLLHGSGGKGCRKKLKIIGNKSRRIENLLKDRFSMGNEGNGRRKEKENIRGRLDKKKDTKIVPRQWHKKACWVF